MDEKMNARKFKPQDKQHAKERLGSYVHDLATGYRPATNARQSLQAIADEIANDPRSRMVDISSQQRPTCTPPLT